MKNAERTIRDFLKSIVNQNYPKKLMTIIVVDGKSEDRTMEITKEQLLSSGIASEFHSDNGAGLGVARQIVFENTQDRYIVWVDSDTVIGEDFVEKQVEFMEKNRRVCVATGSYLAERNANTSLSASVGSLRRYVGSVVAASTRARAKDRGIPPNDASIYRVEAMKEVGGFDTKIRGASEDEDIMSRMREKGWVVTVNELAKYCAILRATWQSLWTECVWFGYGGHFLGHKNKKSHVCMYHIPLVHFYVGFREGSKAYKLTSQKKSFLFPLNDVFEDMGWWYGYAKAHAEGYGHES